MLPLAKSRSACTMRQGAFNPSTVDEEVQVLHSDDLRPGAMSQTLQSGACDARLLRALHVTCEPYGTFRSELRRQVAAVQAVDPPDPPLTQRDCY
jgi:hypothetical protein